jgi:hypothetical protein
MWIKCRNPNLGLTTKAKACECVSQEWKPGITFHVPKSVKECEGFNSHTPKWTPTLGLGVRVSMDFQIFKGHVATLALGSWPRQGLTRLRAKRRPGSEGKCEGMNLHSPKGASTLGVWRPSGLPNFQRAIARVKTQWIEEFFISLKSYWNVDVWNGLAWLIRRSKTQVMAKRKARSQIGNLTPNH